MVRERLWRRAAIIGAGSALVLAAAYPAAASPGPSSGPAAKGVRADRTLHAAGASPAVLTLMRKQAAIDTAADRIEAASPSGSESGLGGLVVEAAHNALKVYWHGSMPRAVMDRISAARAGGITVSVGASPYTRAELTRLAKRFVASDTTGNLSSAGPARDGSGLTTGWRGVSATAAKSQSRALADTVNTDVPITSRAGADVVTDTRQADTQPYWGGAQLITPDGGGCSSGFGVTGWNGAATYILTAAHCGNGAFQTGAGVDMGSSIVTAWGHDTQLILTYAGSWVYDGDDIQGSNQFAKPVAGKSGNHDGDYVCTSGAYSGAVCNIKVTDVGLTMKVENHTVNDMVQAEQQDHTDASGSGDSGGPVFSLTGDEGSDIARGTLTGHDPTTNVACKGVPADATRTCGWRIFFPDIVASTNDLGVNVNTF